MIAAGAPNRTGRWFLPNSALWERRESGPSRSRHFGCRRSSICGRTLTNGRTSRRTRITRTVLRLERYYDWLIDHVFILVPAQEAVGQFPATFQEFPPSQKSGSFSVDQVLEKVREGASGK